MILSYAVSDGWPPLAWLAACRRNGSVHVTVGRDVETRPEWFAEAAWAGEFISGDFDQIEIVTGTGGRLRDGRIVFVASTSTLDRLHSLQFRDETLVSNSLPCLFAATAATLQPSYPYYNRDISSIMYGLAGYKRSIATSAGPVHLTYFDNLVWDGESLAVQSKIEQAPAFAGFERYAGFLQDNMYRLARNAADPERRLKFRLLATISTGYDSPAVAVLAVRAGCRDAITFETSNDGGADSGASIAHTLGLDLRVIPWAEWRIADCAEVPLLASGHPGAVVYAGAARHLHGTVLLTGYQGDKVWDVHSTQAGRHLVRGDASGLGLTEFRLWCAFLHCPIPFWGARRVAEITAISRSDEMRPWVLEDTDYDRPIPRRIVEDAGVARGAFGVAKHAAEPFLWREPTFLTPRGYQDYFEWLARNRGAWLRRFRMPPWANVRGDWLVNSVGARMAALARRIGAAADSRLTAGYSARLRTLHPRLINLRRYWFPWAVERAARKYADTRYPLRPPGQKS